MAIVNGYLIDPEARTVTNVKVDVKDGSGIEDIYRHLGVDCFDLARINRHGDAVFVDDEGLLKDPEYFFAIEGYPEKLAGRGLVLGCDARGETVSPVASFDSVKRGVKFYARCLNILVQQEPA